MVNIKKFQNYANMPIRNFLIPFRCLRGYAVQPLLTTLIITYRCNLECEFCFQKDYIKKDYKTLKMDELKTIEQNLRKSFFLKPRIHLYGGEPTTHTNFLKVADLLSSRGYKIYLTTNSTKEEKILGAIKLKNFSSLNLSINQVSFERAANLLQKIEDSGALKEVEINLNCVVTSQTHDKLVEITKKFENTCADTLTFMHLSFEEVGEVQGINTSKLVSEVKGLKGGEFKIPVFLTPSIKIKDIEKYYTDLNFPNPSKKCYHPWFELRIQPNGDVIPCERVMKKMGNVKTQNLRDVWNGRRFRNFREKIQREGPSSSCCTRCCWREYY